MKFTTRLLAVATCALVFASCTDDVSEEYSKMSGRTYIGAPEVSDIIPGFEKYQIKWSLNADPRINKARVSWADDTEFVLLNIERVEGENGKTLNVTLDNEGTDEKYHDSDIVLDKDTIYLKVNHVSEGAHLVNVTHLGENETSSLVKEMPVSVYGANYQSTLRERPVTEVKANLKETTLTWSNRENCTGVKLTYTNYDGEEVTVDIPRSETVSKLPFVKSESTISYYSYYLPIPSIESISTLEPAIVEVPAISYVYDVLEMESIEYNLELGAVIKWSEEVPEAISKVVLTYINNQNVSTTLEITDFENNTIISDAKEGSEFSYVSRYALSETKEMYSEERTGTIPEFKLEALEIESMEYISGTGAVINWSSELPEGATRVNKIVLEYVNNSGTQTTKEVTDISSPITVDDAVPGGAFAYTVYYLTAAGEMLSKTIETAFPFLLTEVHLRGTIGKSYTDDYGQSFQGSLSIVKINGNYMNGEGVSTYGENYDPDKAINGERYKGKKSGKTYTSENNKYKTISIYLGREVKLSEVHIYIRPERDLYSTELLKTFSVYGTNDIYADGMNNTVNNSEVGYEIPDLSKYILIKDKVTLEKPAGYDSMTDKEKAKIHEAPFVFQMPKNTPFVKYVRIQLLDNMDGYNTKKQIAFSEIEFKGMVKE